MSKLRKLVESYGEFIRIPWNHDSNPEERVMFCVYDEQDELKIRIRIDEFEIATKETNHRWECFDLTDTYPKWFITQRYAERYFKNPEMITHTLGNRFITALVEDFQKYLNVVKADVDNVIALTGVGSLYSFIKVKDVVDKLAPMFDGKLLVFFPGRLVEHNYRLLDGYDGWSYRAVPIVNTY